MFYSHTFLAKKGPLGTVWIAAHLQHKLRKSHVTVTDISSTVDCIMFPEVPIALRLSGHLLLGVVRIYSKKVDYLYHDCNEVLSQMRTMFASVHVNLPEDADRATFQAVTLPDTFELDALDLDTRYLEESPDKHLKDLEQITLPDQIPVEGESYVAIFIEDRFGSSPQIEQPSLSAGAEPMSEEILPGRAVVNDQYVDAILGGGSSVETLHRSINADETIGNFSSIEIARDATRNFGLDNLEIPDFEGLENNILEPDGSVDQARNKKGSVSPTAALPISGEEPLPLFMPENLPAVASADASGVQNTGVSQGGQSLGMELPPSPVERPPSPPVERQNARRRRRKRFFDETIVLSNAEMRKRLEDTSKIVRKRRKLPCSTLDVWKFQKNMKKDQNFNEPLLSGMCTKLQEVYKRVFPVVTDLSSPNTMHEVDVEMEQAGHNEMHDQDLPEPDVEIEQARFNGMHDQDLPEPMPSPFERELTPIDSMISINKSVPRKIITPELEMPSRLEIPPSAEQLNDRTETSSVNLEDPLVPEMRLSPEVPGLLNSPDEDLFFLDAENTPSPSPSPSGHESRRFGSMSSRTRLVAQYLREQSPVTQSSNSQSGHLSLNKILEGKRRKQCARMFFETLVLKTCDLIDVEQEEAYGDISISVTPTLSKLAM